MDALRLTIVWHPSLTYGRAIAEAIAEVFDRLGMVRDHVRLSVPVQIRCTGLKAPEASPRTIDLDRAEVNGIIVLSNRGLVRGAAREWQGFFDHIENARKRKGEALFVLNIAADSRGQQLPMTRHENVVRSFVGRLRDFEGRVARHFLIKLMTDIGICLKKWEIANLSGVVPNRIEPEKIFLSHSSRDGRDVAMWIREYLQAHKTTLGVESFLDVKDLPGGAAHREYFSEQIGTGSLLAIQTDSYGARPYCGWEFLEAKRHRRPILALSHIERGEERVFPYGGNVTSRLVRRATSASAPLWSRWMGSTKRRGTLEDAETERIVQDVLSEVLRCQVFRLQARLACIDAGCTDAIILPRPPELVDLAYLMQEAFAEKPRRLVVYPDPPLHEMERDVLDKLAGPIEFKALSELR